jgi:hypothetical protein
MVGMLAERKLAQGWVPSDPDDDIRPGWSLETLS